MNNKIESLSKKLRLLEHNWKDILTKDIINTVCTIKVDSMIF